MWADSWAGVAGHSVIACCVSRCWMTGLANMGCSAVCSRLTSSAGMRAGPNSPVAVVELTGKPASRSVGTSGTSGERLSPEMARILMRPALCISIRGCRPVIITGRRPAARSTMPTPLSL